MNAYGYPEIKLSELTSISRAGNHFYSFKGLNFLCKLNPKNSKIVFVFHGARANSDKVIFRGYDYQINDTDIVCISDYLICAYNDYTVNWTLATRKHDSDPLYREIIGYLLQKKYDKVVFTGTSAGGYPSIKFACYFHSIALISNSQLYLEDYSEFETLTRMLATHGDAVIYENKEIERIILQHKPRKIVVYVNEEDTTYSRDILPLLEFAKQNKLEALFEVNVFSWNKPLPKGKKHHHIQFPNNQKHLNVLKSLLKRPIAGNL